MQALSSSSGIFGRFASEAIGCHHGLSEALSIANQVGVESKGLEASRSFFPSLFQGRRFALKIFRK